MKLPINSAKKYQGKKNKGKIFEKHNSGLISKRVTSEKFKELNKTVH